MHVALMTGDAPAINESGHVQPVNYIKVHAFLARGTCLFFPPCPSCFFHFYLLLPPSSASSLFFPSTRARFIRRYHSRGCTHNQCCRVPYLATIACAFVWQYQAGYYRDASLLERKGDSVFIYLLRRAVSRQNLRESANDFAFSREFSNTVTCYGTERLYKEQFHHLLDTRRQFSFDGLI